MMYRVYCDGQLLYHSKLEGLKIYAPSLELEVNKTGSFQFTMYPDHPRYSLIRKLKSIITVYQDDFLLFRGRVLEDETGWHNEKTVTCEGQLAFLLDSIIRPYEFTGSVTEYLSMLIELHNAQVDAEKRFVLGNVTVTDPNDYIIRSNIEYTDTWTEMNAKLLDLLGGYIIIRYEGGTAYLDYLASINVLAQQAIEFGKNLLYLKRIAKGADIATVVIPLGAKLKDEEGKDTDVRLTIASVNGGADYVEDGDAIAQYGTIVKTVIFDDVTDAENLKTKGKAHLAQSVKWPETIELTAADLSAAGVDVTSFHIATQVRVTSRPHGISQLFLVSKLSINLLDPGANKMTLGSTLIGLAGSLAGVTNVQGMILQEVNRTAQKANEAVYNVEQNLLASMQVEADNIKSVVAETYTLKDDTEALVSDVRLEITQTKDSYDLEFIQFRQDIDAAANGADAQFEEIRKYIRFPDGKILIGEVGNELELQIANDRISFLQDGAEVAYFSNRKLYVTDAQILHSLQLGNFAFMPRANGNLSFKKI